MHTRVGSRPVRRERWGRCPAQLRLSMQLAQPGRAHPAQLRRCEHKLFSWQGLAAGSRATGPAPGRVPWNGSREGGRYERGWPRWAPVLGANADTGAVRAWRARRAIATAAWGLQHAVDQRPDAGPRHEDARRVTKRNRARLMLWGGAWPQGAGRARAGTGGGAQTWRLAAGLARGAGACMRAKGTEGRGAAARFLLGAAAFHPQRGGGRSEADLGAAHRLSLVWGVPARGARRGGGWGAGRLGRLRPRGGGAPAVHGST
jgi:hypothetical protein